MSTSTIRPIINDATRLRRADLVFWTPLRNALGVFLPLAVGVPLGQTGAAVTVALGALLTSFADWPAPYRRRGGLMLLTTVAGAFSAFVAAVTSDIGPLAVALLALWGLAAGIFVLWGPAPLQVGLNNVLVMLVFGANALTPGDALQQAGLYLLGGLVQTALSVVAWPVRRYAPEQQGLAAVYHALATYTAMAGSSDKPPTLAAEVNTAHTLLVGLEDDHSNTAESLRMLLDQSERLRLELLALDRARFRFRNEGGAVAVLDRLDELWQVASGVLDDVAATLARQEPLSAADTHSARLDAAIRLLHWTHDNAAEQQDWREARLLAHADSLAGELRAVVELSGSQATLGITGMHSRHVSAVRRRAISSIIRANLTTRSAVFRHALRLAICLAVAGALTRYFNLAWGFWVPLTAALVLRPDFATTYSRGLGRVGGTLLGLIVATALTYAIGGAAPGLILAAGVLTFLARTVAMANFALFSAWATALIVVLLALAGHSPEATIVQRGINTLLGGTFAMLLYLLWPTWERNRTAGVLADLLDAYRDYFTAVTGQLLQGAESADLSSARLAARLARSNAEASLGRLRGEPRANREEIELASGVLAASHRFVNSALELEAWLYPRPHIPPGAAANGLRKFVADTEIVLQALAQMLRGMPPGVASLPLLREDQNALSASEPEDLFFRAILSETERIVNSLNTILYLVTGQRSQQ